MNICARFWEIPPGCSFNVAFISLLDRPPINKPCSCGCFNNTACTISALCRTFCVHERLLDCHAKNVQWVRRSWGQSDLPEEKKIIIHPASRGFPSSQNLNQAPVPLFCQSCSSRLHASQNTGPNCGGNVHAGDDHICCYQPLGFGASRFKADIQISIWANHDAAVTKLQVLSFLNDFKWIKSCSLGCHDWSITD